MKEGNRNITDVPENRKSEILESIVNVCIKSNEENILEEIIKILTKNELIK